MKQQFKLWLALAAVGAAGGLVGIVLTEIMHAVQHFAYGYSNAGGYTPFRVGVEAAPPLRRLPAIIAPALRGVAVRAAFLFYYKKPPEPVPT